MHQTWRWFGPADIVSVDAMLQAGVEGVVSAIHHVPAGAVWTPHEIAKRQREIATRKDGTASGLAWDVVESLPVSEDIKKQKGEWKAHVEAYKQSLKALADAGLDVVCYNFMPVLDWTRTAIAHRVSHGGTCMRFDIADFAAFDIHVLRRPGSMHDFSPQIVEEAARRHAGMTDDDQGDLVRTVIAGLLGSASGMTLDDVRHHLAEYDGIPADRLRSNLVAFLEQVVPVAEQLGVRLCCHPDDPPFPLLGLPRIMSTEDDYVRILNAIDSGANGMTFCTGSLGARPDNDLPGMMERIGDRVHFLHLRNVKRESDALAGSFHEAEHLGGDTDIVAVIAAVLREEVRRRARGRPDCSIPFRPDHGQDICDDLGRRTQPGYPLIGRLKGLAELRGIMTALEHPVARLAT